MREKNKLTINPNDDDEDDNNVIDGENALNNNNNNANQNGNDDNSNGNSNSNGSTSTNSLASNDTGYASSKNRKRFKSNNNKSYEVVVENGCCYKNFQKALILDSINLFHIEIDKRLEHFEETKNYVDKIFEFYEDDIEIRILSLQTEVEKFQDDMYNKIDKFKQKIKRKPFTVKKLRKLEYNIRKLEARVLKYKHDEAMLNKITFHLSDTQLSLTDIGALHDPLNQKYEKIKAAKSITIPFELLVCLTYFDETKRIIITDFNDRSFKILDLNGNYLGSYNPDSVLERPGPIGVSNIAKELYIQDHVYEKIFVFDLNFNYLRDFGDERCQTPFGMATDEIESRIYLSAYLNNIVTVWDTKTGDFVTEIKIYSPTFMQIYTSKLFIMSATESEIFTIKNSLQAAEHNQNSIYIYNKFNYEVLKKIKIENCVHPKGLYCDDNMNIFITAYDIELFDPNNQQNEASPHVAPNNNLFDYDQTPTSTFSHKSRFLFKISENGEFLQKTNLSLSGIFSMVMVEKKLYAIRGYRSPPIYMIEFE